MTEPIAPAHLIAQARRLAEWIEKADSAVEGGKAIDSWLAQAFRKHRNCGARDRRLIANTVFSFFRWRGWLAAAPTLEYPGAVYWAHLLDAPSPEPITPTLAAAAGLPEPEATLGGQSLADKAKALDHSGLFGEPLQPTQLVPDWWSDAHAGLDDETRHRLVAAYQERPLNWLRCRRGTRDRIVERLQGWGYPAHAHPVLADALSVSEAISRAHLQQIEQDVELQDLASQCVGRVAAPIEGQTWWDACCGGGGKTVQLGDYLGQTGQLLATDMRKPTIQSCRERWKTARLKLPAEIKVADARRWRPHQPCDGVLVDAPCTGMGTWARNPDARWRTPADGVSQNAARQRALLDNAAQAVRPGGLLVYAVCTTSDAETTEQAERFLRKHPEFAADPFPHPLTGQTTEGTVRIDPWDGSCGGMYIARWRKQA
jgi:16S rRNA (cytosine967-C5)-methyltransferase